MPLDRVPRFLASLHRWERLAIASWTILVLAICIRAAIWPYPHSVYPIFSLASQNWRAGADVYGPTQYDMFRYSPLVAAAFVPLGILPDSAGGVLWRLLSVSAYLVALAWWGRCILSQTGDASRARIGTAVLLLLTLPLSADNLNNAQSNMLLTALLLIGTLACGAGRWNLAAACVAIACLFKVYPISAGLLLAVVYPRRFAGRFALALAIGLVLPFLLQRPSYVLEEYAIWLGHLRRDERQGEDIELWYRDLRLLCRACGMPLSAAMYTSIQMTLAAGIALLCYAARRAGWPHRKIAPMLLGLACCWMTAFGAAAETSTYMLLAPITSWYIVDAWLHRRAYWLRSFHLGVYALFVLARIGGWLPEGRRFSMVAQPMSAILLFIGLITTAVWQLCHSRLASEPDSSACHAQTA
jgi:hypothetical protein